MAMQNGRRPTINALPTWASLGLIAVSAVLFFPLWLLSVLGLAVLWPFEANDRQDV